MEKNRRCSATEPQLPQGTVVADDSMPTPIISELHGHLVVWQQVMANFNIDTDVILPKGITL